MPNRKKPKTIDDLSVTKLLDDFVRLDASPIEKPTHDMSDEDYIKMMLKKHVQRELERSRRESSLPERERTQSMPSDTLDEAIQRRYFPYVNDDSTQTKMPVEDDIVNEIMGTLTAEDVSELAAKMRKAVDFVQDELGESDSEN